MFNRSLKFRKFILPPISRKTYSTNNKNIVYFDYSELNDKSVKLNDKIEKAFGLDGLGIAIVKNIPNFENSRYDYFQSFIDFYKLPIEVKSKYRCKTRDPIGWIDAPKTGMYKNENGNDDFLHQFYMSRYPNETVRYPSNPKLENESKNVWPLETPKYKTSFMNYLNCCSGTIRNTLFHLENYLGTKIPNYNQKLYKLLNNDYVISCQTIIYLPTKQFKKDWNGWHTDVNILTGLSFPCYYNKNFDVIDINFSGLYIKDRRGIEHELNFKKDEFLIFPSALYFYLSAGHILPLEHSVNLPEKYSKDIYRANKSCFFEPQYDIVLNIPTDESVNDIMMRDPRKMEYSEVKNFKGGIDFRSYMLEICTDLLVEIK